MQELQQAPPPRSPSPDLDELFPSFLPIIDELLALKMSHPYRLPLRGASGAPAFDPEQPQTLLDYFEDLEFIFEEAAIYEDEKCKAHAVRYAPSTEKHLWRSFASFKSGAYEPFKQDVIKEYLGEGGKRLYSVGDLKVIVADALKTGFRSISDFKLYSRKFRVVADYLVEHAVLRVDERDRWFLKALPERLQAPVLDRLRYKCPDVLAPRIPYTVEQVTEATEFILDAQDEDGPGISSVAPSGPLAHIRRHGHTADQDRVRAHRGRLEDSHGASSRARPTSAAARDSEHRSSRRTASL